MTQFNGPEIFIFNGCFFLVIPVIINLHKISTVMFICDYLVMYVVKQ